MKLDRFAIYDELPFWSAPFGMTMLEMVKITKRIRILDIGSGGGFPMLELAERFGSTSEIYGLDPSDDSMEMISEKILARGISNARIVKGFAEKIPFSDSFFNLITANNGLNNVQDDEAALRECHRVAAPGAQMVLTMNLPHTMMEFYRCFEQVLTDLNMEETIQLLDNHIFEKRKPVDYWRERISLAGFEIISIQIDGFRMRFADGTTFLNHFFIRTAFMDAWRSITTDRDVFPEIEAKLNEAASSTGELIMSVPYACFDCRRL